MTSFLGGTLNAGAVGGLFGSPAPTVAHTTSKVTTAVQHAATSALGGVVNPILRDLKYAAIWVGLVLLGFGLIFEGLSRNGAPVPKPSMLLMAGAE